MGMATLLKWGRKGKVKGGGSYRIEKGDGRRGKDSKGVIKIA